MSDSWLLFVLISLLLSLVYIFLFSPSLKARFAKQLSINLKFRKCLPFKCVQTLITQQLRGQAATHLHTHLHIHSQGTNVLCSHSGRLMAKRHWSGTCTSICVYRLILSPRTISRRCHLNFVEQKLECWFFIHTFVGSSAGGKGAHENNE